MKARIGGAEEGVAELEEGVTQKRVCGEGTNKEMGCNRA